jgi:hypothetical protein
LTERFYREVTNISEYVKAKDFKPSRLSWMPRSLLWEGMTAVVKEDLIRSGSAINSDIKTEGDDVPVFDDIILAFQAKPAGCLCPGQCVAAGNEVIVTHDFGLDEAPLKIVK